MKKVAIYGRVSTKDQDPESQLLDLRKYVKLRNWTIYQEYVDRGVSGTKESRPALDKLMKDARKRKFDILLVWKFDRFARSTKHLVNALEELEVWVLISVLMRIVLTPLRIMGSWYLPLWEQ